jgi:hypothetical protein
VEWIANLCFLLFRFFSEAVFGAIHESAEIYAVFPYGENCDDDGECEEWFVPCAVLNAAVVP